MLSTQYRLRLEFICKRISNHEEVQLEDMIWAEKLAKANRYRNSLKYVRTISDTMKLLERLPN